MPLQTEVRDQLVSLNMNHAAIVLSELIEQAQTEDWTHLQTISALLGKEQTKRADKARDKRMNDAAFPYHASVEQFDFTFQRSVSKKHMLQLKEFSWLENAFNILFIGPPSVGKTHLAVSLGIEAVNVNKKVDRLMHKCEVFDMDGDSYRLAHRERILKI